MSVCWTLPAWRCGIQNFFSSSSVSPLWTCMEELIPLTDFTNAACRGISAMSRRKVSVKDLGNADCHGWLYKKRESRTFLRNKWKKYWLVLKGSSLYWYSNASAEKAEGYISLRGFTLDQASECKRKWAIKASHPQVVTLFFAAENTKDMHKWLSKLTAASSKQELTDTDADCYSEASDEEEEEGEDTAEEQVLNTEQLTVGSFNGLLPPPRSSSSPCRIMVPLISPVCNSSDSESWLELSTESQASISEPSHPGRLQDYHGDDQPPSDELEMLYLHLKNARLSPCGTHQPSTKRDYRSSFIRRCKNDDINEKLHMVRALNSTLKAKEADLFAIEQVLGDSALDASKYREWRKANVLLMEEINQKTRTAEDAQTQETSRTDQTQLQCAVPAVYAETTV